MRKTITAIAAAAALGTVTMASSAMAFPKGGFSGSVGHMSAPGGTAMGTPNTSFGAHGPGNFAAPPGGQNFAAKPNTVTAPNNFGAQPNTYAAGPKNNWNGKTWNGNTWNGQHYAYSDHDHDRGHGHGHGYWGGGWGGLYAFGGPDYYDYYAGDSCYQWRRVWTPFGWRWRDVWVCN